MSRAANPFSVALPRIFLTDVGRTRGQKRATRGTTAGPANGTTDANSTERAEDDVEFRIGTIPGGTYDSTFRGSSVLPHRTTHCAPIETIVAYVRAVFVTPVTRVPSYYGFVVAGRQERSVEPASVESTEPSATESPLAD